MDKLKGFKGWHPSGDRPIHRETWKSDLKGIATRKNKDPYEEQRNHESRPLGSLKDPDSFGPPPKRTTGGYSGSSVSRAGTASSSTAESGPSGGWGAPAVQSGYAEQKRLREERERQQMEEQVQEVKREPYRTDTSGLRTDNLPKPPVRRAEAASPAQPSLPPRQPPRQAAAPVPTPSLPPRQNEYPDEHTPAPPPTYNEAVRDPPVPARHDPAAINQGAAQRLGQAGVSIPGFGIGGGSGATASHAEAPAAQGPPAGQLSELQQRFARMNTGAGSGESLASPASPSSPVSGIAHKKAPPPPPPKKAALHAPAQHNSGSAGFNNETPPPPPPLPMSSKPRP